MDSQIKHYLIKQHVLTLCAMYDAEIWCANCFYCFDINAVELIIMSEPTTQHGQLMLQQPCVAGTITEQIMEIEQLQGIQFTGVSTLLQDEAAQRAYSLYCQRFPIILQHYAPLWSIRLDKIKMMDNTQTFGRKIYWQRTGVE